MFRLEYLYALIIAALLAIVFVLFSRLRKRKISRLEELLPKKSWKQYFPFFDEKLHWIKHIALFLSMVFMLLAFANPQKRGMPKWETKEGKDVVFALDLSNSMLADDIKPNRLTQAKEFIQRYIAENKSDQIGLIVFAGNAYIQTPLSTDPNAVLMHLQQAHPDQMPLQGTRIAMAIEKAETLFMKEEMNNQVLVIVSDGEDHESDAVAAAKRMAKDGINIYTIGVGSPEGARIFEPYTKTYKTDGEGNEIISKMNEQMLTELAEAGGGNYLYLQHVNQTAQALSKQLSKVSGSVYQAWMPGVATSYAFALMGISLILLLLYFTLVIFKFEKNEVVA